mmetsp:Transcript_32965/g.71993  ORF Transcript_32965/g.71993 Transcript_32965/m.71993 type:complete len:257 (-) Transcript_32965:1081-1851(-)
MSNTMTRRDQRFTSSLCSAMSAWKSWLHRRRVAFKLSSFCAGRVQLTHSADIWSSSADSRSSASIFTLCCLHTEKTASINAVGSEGRDTMVTAHLLTLGRAGGMVASGRNSHSKPSTLAENISSLTGKFGSPPSGTRYSNSRQKQHMQCIVLWLMVTTLVPSKLATGASIRDSCPCAFSFPISRRRNFFTFLSGSTSAKSLAEAYSDSGTVGNVLLWTRLSPDRRLYIPCNSLVSCDEKPISWRTFFMFRCFPALK